MPYSGRKRQHESSDPLLFRTTSTGRSRVKRRLLVKEGALGGDKFLMEVARAVGPKWEELGIALGLDFGTIKSTVSDVGSKPEHMKAFYILQEWKCRACNNFTYTTLASALEEAGLQSCAQRYCYTNPGLGNEDWSAIDSHSHTLAMFDMCIKCIYSTLSRKRELLLKKCIDGYTFLYV